MSRSRLFDGDPELLLLDDPPSVAPAAPAARPPAGPPVRWVDPPRRASDALPFAEDPTDDPLLRTADAHPASGARGRLGGPPLAPPLRAAVVPPPVGPPSPARPAPAAALPANYATVDSPMVGTMYRAPAPNAKPYVEVGDLVQKGQVLCIIEAMKLMNQIESEHAGVVRKVLVENGAPVQFGQPLFVIERT